MDYQKYIELGFTRTDTTCTVEFSRTGYYGFALEKHLNEKQLVCVSSGELDKPKLYIKKRNSETYHIIPITPEAVIDLFDKQKTIDSKSKEVTWATPYQPQKFDKFEL